MPGCAQPFVCARLQNFPGISRHARQAIYAALGQLAVVDLCLARIKKVCESKGAILVVTADHGNADQMLEKNKKGNVEIRTAHSLNPVPFIVYDPDQRHELKEGTAFGLANVAPTVAGLLGIKPFDCWEESMLK